MTEEDIAEYCETDVRTIQHLRNDDDQNPTAETVMQLCLAMQLPPQVSRIMMVRSGHSLKANNKDFMYGFFLDGCYLYSLEGCNKMLVDQGIKPFGSKSRKTLKETDPELYKKLL